MGPAVAAAWVVIVLGAIWVLGPLRMLPMAAAFLVTMALAVAAFAALGPCFDAVWRSDSVCGLNYWIGIALSPELAIFALFMMSDPRTAPSTQRSRLVFGVATAVVASGLLALQPTEYGVKVAILAALMVVLSMVPVIDGRSVDSAGGLVGGLIAMIVVLLVFSLVSNEDLIRTERGGGSSSFGRGQGLRLPAPSEAPVEELAGTVAGTATDRAGPPVAEAVRKVEVLDHPAPGKTGPPEHPGRRALAS